MQTSQSEVYAPTTALSNSCTLCPKSFQGKCQETRNHSCSLDASEICNQPILNIDTVLRCCSRKTFYIHWFAYYGYFPIWNTTRCNYPSGQTHNSKLARKSYTTEKNVPLTDDEMSESSFMVSHQWKFFAFFWLQCKPTEEPSEQIEMALVSNFIRKHPHGILNKLWVELKAAFS